MQFAVKIKIASFSDIKITSLNNLIPISTLHSFRSYTTYSIQIFAIILLLIFPLIITALIEQID